MSKSIKLKNSTYWDTSGIYHNKQPLNDFISNNVNMVVTTNMAHNNWVKICNIKFETHIQGSFVYLKIFIATGNNGEPSQHAYIDLVMQMGWTGSDSGRFGCYAELHPLGSSFTTSNIGIKVISNNYLDYDIWLDLRSQQYCRPNYIVFAKEDAIVTPHSLVSSNEPTGTECKLSFVSI